MDATTVRAHHREQCLDLIVQRFGEPANISKLLDWIDAHMEGRSAQDVLLAFESEHHATRDAHPSEHPGCVHCNPRPCQTARLWIEIGKLGHDHDLGRVRDAVERTLTDAGFSVENCDLRDS